MTHIHDDIGWIYAAMDEPEAAYAALARASELHDELGATPRQRLHTTFTTLEVHVRCGRADDARRLLAAVDELESESEVSLDWDAEADTVRGMVYLLAGDRTRAAALFRHAIWLGAEREFRNQVANALDGLAAAELELDPESAARTLGMADRVRAEAGGRPWLPRQHADTVAGVTERLGLATYAELRARGQALGLTQIGASMEPAS
jgi:ATP/maltotriose-dependent transcriptional regulator MalT